MAFQEDVIENPLSLFEPQGDDDIQDDVQGFEDIVEAIQEEASETDEDEDDLEDDDNSSIDSENEFIKRERERDNMGCCGFIFWL